MASRSPPTSPPVGFRTETTAAGPPSASGANTWSGSAYRHRPRTVVPARRSRVSASVPSRPTRAGSRSAGCGYQQEVVADPGEDRIDSLTRLEVCEHEGAPAAHPARVALHDGQVGADVRCQVDLVDEEQVRAHDAGPALARDLLALRDVDDVDRGVHELGAERRGQIIAAAFDQEQVELGKFPHEKMRRLKVHGRVFPDRRVGAAARLDADDPRGRQGAAPDQKLRVLLRVDVVGDHGHVEPVAQPQAQRLGQRGLARADGTADSDLQRAREAGLHAHDLNSLVSSVAWRSPASSRPGLKLHRSSTSAESERRVWRSIWRLAARNSGTHVSASRRASRETAPATSPRAASRVACATTAASHGPALPSRWATTNASRPAASTTRPSCTYVSRPNEWTKPPAGKRPSASWRSARNAGSVMAVTRADGHEHCGAALEDDAKPREELVHRRVVWHQEPLTVEREHEVAVADLERDPDRLLARARRDDEHGLGRRLDRDVPARADVEDVAGYQDAARRERQRERPPGARGDASTPPAPLFRGEREHVPLEPDELCGVHVDVWLGDDRHGRAAVAIGPAAGIAGAIEPSARSGRPRGGNAGRLGVPGATEPRARSRRTRGGIAGRLGVAGAIGPAARPGGARGGIAGGLGVAGAIEPAARSRRARGGIAGRLGVAGAIEPSARSRRTRGGIAGRLGVAGALEPSARSRRTRGGIGGRTRATGARQPSARSR